MAERRAPRPRATAGLGLGIALVASLGALAAISFLSRSDALHAEESVRAAVGRARWEAQWRALDHLGEAALNAPRAVTAYAQLLRSGLSFNRNPFAKHAPPRDRLDLFVTRFMDRRKKTFDLRAALYLPPPARIEWSLAIPTGAKLRLGLARTGAAVLAKIEVDGEVLASRRPSGRWRDEELDLARFAGRTVKLALVTEGRGHVFFADPTLVAPRAAEIAGRASKDAPNVVVVLVDTLAAWSLGCYGHSPSVTPNLDRFCQEGVRYDNAIAQSNWTRPSVTSMLTSWLPGKIGITYNVFHGHDIAPERRRFYGRAPATLPRLLRDAGYVTGALVNNLFLQGYHKYGVDLGFEQVVDYRTHVEDTVDITEDAIRFAERNRDGRFFLFLNYNAPHIHYVPPAKHAAAVNRILRGRGGAKTRAYLGEVRYTDAEVGRLLGALDRMGLAENTLVVLTADHGEVHDPRHSYRVVKTGRVSLFSHAVTMYDDEVRVPFVLRWPGKLRPGSVVKSQVRHLDFAPTVLDAAGLSPSPKHQGKSHLGLARGESESEERVAFIEGRMMRAVRAGGFKYFWRLPGYERIAKGGRTRAVPEELYDLAADPHEYRNLVDEPRIGERLAKLRALGRRLMDHDAAPDSDASTASAPAPVVPASAPPSTVSAGSTSGPARVHLVFVSDGQPRRFEGKLSVPGGARHYRLRHEGSMDAIWREADGSVRFRVDVERARESLWVEPAGDPSGGLRLELTMDGKAAPLRVGPFGLPLLEPGAVAGPELALLDARDAPPVRPGREVGAFLFRQGGAGAPPSVGASTTIPEVAPVSEAEERPASGGAAEREVEGMMRDWGYIQGGKE